jgi:hypothetical protein
VELDAEEEAKLKLPALKLEMAKLDWCIERWTKRLILKPTEMAKLLCKSKLATYLEALLLCKSKRATSLASLSLPSATNLLLSAVKMSEKAN